MTTIINQNIVTFHNKSDISNSYRVKLESDLLYALDELLFIFSNQMDDEIQANNTYHNNRIGFNKPDAKVLSQIAKDKLDGKELTEIQTNEVLKRMPKYAIQIMNHRIRSGQIVKCNGYYSL